MFVNAKPDLTPAQVEAVAAILVALGRVPKGGRMVVLAIAIRTWLDSISGRDQRPQFQELVARTGLDR